MKTIVLRANLAEATIIQGDDKRLKQVLLGQFGKILSLKEEEKVI
jgi:hypothetical protein